MTPDLARWPHLKLPTHPVLDWVETEYTTARLTEIADAVSANPHPIQTRTAQGLRGVWDPAIENVLRTLAANDAALKALNHRRATPPERVVGLNRAVHVLVLAELHPKRKATAIWAEVAAAWGKRPATVKGDVGKYKVKNPREYRPDDAQRLMLTIVHNSCRASGRPREQVLKDFDADLCHRARQLRGAK